MQVKHRIFKLFSGSLLLCFISTSFAQAAPYDDGMQNFKAKRYHAAEIDFENGIVKNPADTRALLMLGKTREFLLDPDGAKEAYSAAFNINPFNADGLSAKQALMDLTANVEAKKHAPLDDPATMRKTAGTIQRQGQQLGDRYVAHGNAMAAARQRLTDDTDRANFLNGTDRYRRRQRFRMNSGGELSDWGSIQRSYRIYDDRAQALNHQAAAKQSAFLANQSATNLVTLLGEHGYSTSPHLRALGTNLYVRNYATNGSDELPPEDPLIELHAKEWTLSTMPTQLQAKQKKL